VDTSKELKSNRPLNVISFCSGYGGIERGLDLAGTDHRVLAYVEIEAYAIANLVNKMESGQLDAAPIYSNLKTFPAHLFRDCVDLITGGYPCQPFSSAGKRGGEQDPRHLWPYIREHINAIRPTQCFFENVEGHISLGLSSVISDMEEDGYSTTWQIFSASEIGAPHQRKRVYILGSLQYANTDSGDGSSKQEREHEGAEELIRSSEGRVGSPFPNANSSTLRHQSERTTPRRFDIQTGGEAQSGIDGEEKSLANASIPARHDAEADSQCTDTNSIGSHRKEEHQRRRIQRGVELQDKQVSESRQIRQNVADTTGIGTQGLRPSGEQKPYAHGQAKLPMREGERPRPTAWPAEPNVGRVVDGCADRVDRIRLLGNGVVPQTAAKAWSILNDR